MKIYLSLAIAFLLTTTALRAEGYNEKFLGGARSLKDCCNLAWHHGFDRCTFGGYVGNVYYWNACYGFNSHPSPTGTNAHWKTEANFVSINTSLFSIAVTDHKGYAELRAPLESFRQRVKILIEAGEDNASTTTIKKFFYNAQNSFNNLAEKYYVLHQSLQNSEVEDAWQELMNAMNRLEEDLE